MLRQILMGPICPFPGSRQQSLLLFHPPIGMLGLS